MKLFTLFITAAIAKKNRPVQDPEIQLDKYQDHVNFMWTTWYSGCGEKPAKTNLLKVVERIRSKYKKCGFFDASLPNGGPNPTDRRRRDIFEDGAGEENNSESENSGSLMEARLSKTDKGKATLQIELALKRFADRYMAGCQSGMDTETIKNKGKKFSAKFGALKCQDG